MRWRLYSGGIVVDFIWNIKELVQPAIYSLLTGSSRGWVASPNKAKQHLLKITIHPRTPENQNILMVHSDSADVQTWNNTNTNAQSLRLGGEL